MRIWPRFSKRSAVAWLALMVLNGAVALSLWRAGAAGTPLVENLLWTSATGAVVIALYLLAETLIWTLRRHPSNPLGKQ